ncbi:hypothetical protein M3G47_10795 [Corynebacterium sanguinis]|uniref:hypothetical protein n=1 Tax=Corynebacterium sanguinis TaxID=2594913 RepID=UPI0021A470FF|nr:hypothetical protein [Corynebacterium sanguinis]MCT1493394.1 hypothetical protein [Corynebacterium sanguinis]MCT2248550.1 hypothetical protein [Corynebacterium sanguinis]
MLCADHAHDGVGKLKSRTGLFQDEADERAEDDDETEGLERGREAVPDYRRDARGKERTVGVFDVEQRNPADQAEDQSHEKQGEEGVDLPPRDHQDQNDDRDDEHAHQRQAGHATP